MFDTQRQEQGERLKKIRAYLGINQNDMSEMLSITQPQLSRIERGSHFISMEIMIVLLKNYPLLDMNWLITGRGEMVRSAEVEPMLSMAAEPAGQYVATLKSMVEFMKEKFPDFDPV